MVAERYAMMSASVAIPIIVDTVAMAAVAIVMVDAEILIAGAVLLRPNEITLMSL